MGEEKKASDGGGGGGADVKKAAPPAAEEGKAKEKEKEEEQKSKAPAPAEEGKKDGSEAAPAPAPPPEEVVMRVYMHCEGCARKVKRCLRGFDGVEDVKADSRAHRVVVKGRKAAAEPARLVDRVAKKTGRKVELLSPLPPPPPAKTEDSKPADEKKEGEPPAAAKPEEKKEAAEVMVVIKVHMHCEACALGIKKTILKMKGVQCAEPDLKASQVTVRGVVDPAKLVEHVQKRTGKHASVVKTEPEPDDKKPPADAPKDAGAADEKKSAAADAPKDGGAAGADQAGKDAAAGGAAPSEAAAAAAASVAQAAYVYYPIRYGPPPAYIGDVYATYPAPQLFSDENPNACSVM